jgi:hypothetical protein
MYAMKQVFDTQDVIAPFPHGRVHTVARHWRSTWIISSIRTLKERGHYERYERFLDPVHRDAVLHAVAGVWLPIDAARAHYEACGALDLSRSEQIGMGLAVGERAHGTVLRTAVRMATGAGVTPWTIFPQMNRLWERGADGGAAQVRRLGPKEALIETVGCALFDVPYFRRAFGGVVLGVVRLFCGQAYVRDTTEPSAQRASKLIFQWA